MFKKISLAAVVALGTVLTGCGGGGGGGNDGNPSGGGGGSTNPTVAGPLDTVQASLSDSVISPLKSAAIGTPLEDVLACTDSVVNQNVLDIADAFAAALANPATLASTAPAEAQAAVMSLIANLSGYLNSLSSLTNVATCTGDAFGGTSIPTSNPLAGTPLEALGTQMLQALTQAQALIPTNGSALSAAQLNSIVTLLSSGFTSGLGGIGTDPSDLPIIGGSLLSVEDALAQLQLLTAGGAAGIPDPTALAAQFQTLAQSVLSGQLTQLLPVGDLQSLAGGGDLLATFQAAITQLTGGLGTLGAGGLPALPANPLSGAGFAGLDSLLDLFTGAGGLPTALDGATLTQLLNVGGSNPLTALISSLTTPIGGGGGGSCTLPILGPILGLC